jgi:adenine-specific DNA-methyltransferase
MAVAIDDNELVNLWKLLEAEFPDHDVTPVVVVHNPRGNITNNFAKVHEYALFLTEKWSSSILRTIEESGSLRKMRRWGENSRRTDRPTMFYPIYVKDEQITRIGDRPDDSFHPTGKNVKLETGETEIWPIDQDGVERRWNFGLDSIHQNLDRIVVSGTDGLLDLFVSAEKSVPKTVWSGGEFDAGKYGNNLLISIIGQKLFSFPKSINNVAKCLDIVCREDETALVLDFFGGSGTTGHAVINLNREHGGRRKFILAEMGEYFDSVLKTRIQKVAYSKDWRDGKPVSREGSSHLFKYIRLESYEDALNNIEMRRNAEQASLLEAHEDFREDYVLRYMLDVEARGSASLLNVESFADPFNYQLNVATGASVGETRPVAVDLVETFNYLLGLSVRRVEDVCGFRVVKGTNPEGEKVLVIWRNTREKSNDDLDQFFSEQGYNTRDREFDIIYTNGDNNLENLRRPDETWKMRLIEESFQRLMFDVQDV